MISENCGLNSGTRTAEVLPRRKRSHSAQIPNQAASLDPNPVLGSFVRSIIKVEPEKGRQGAK